MTIEAAIRLTGNLNVLRHTAVSAEVSAREVVADDVAHHVVDPEGLLDLNPLAANELDIAMRAAITRYPGDWSLILPRPGMLGALRGPAALTRLALEMGAAVVSQAGGLGWVPQPVGSAVQWVVLPAEKPALPTAPTEADRHLSETVLRIADALAAQEMSSGERPEPVFAPLPAAYGGRAKKLATKALRLIHAADAALADDSGLLHSHAIQTRRTALREVQRAAIDALSAAVSWVEPPPQ
ncbi:hypothetical protein [Granulicoccus phenolivorans]|uniref:hypothetical protein n=1 Tax=Granulicoccus phenolivorans TaxID=266854 RepID=UPI000413D0F0|nr:hypothetical protein [Granulicoccus phenolivorans]